MGLVCSGDASIKSACKMTQKLQPIVLSGPSGCGKSTLIKKLTTEFPSKFGFSVSHTTRAPRPGEIDGKDYHFITLEAINKKIEDGEFVESATFSGNKYGTSKKAVEDVLETGKICILDIDSQGVKSIKKTDLNCVLIFIKPPSLEELEKRLRSRGTEIEEAIQRRLASAKSELDYAAEVGSYHFIIVNDDLEKAYKELKEIISQDDFNAILSEEVMKELRDSMSFRDEIIIFERIGFRNQRITYIKLY